MTVQNALRQLASQLSSLYERSEAMNIADLVIEKLTNLERKDRIIHKDRMLAPEQEQLLQSYTNDLLQHRPVQYVLQEAWFAGMKFYVNENVLIPRPETEELVEWIAPDDTIFDIGTGSGCIPITLKKKFPTATIHACDISESALQIAHGNAEANKVSVEFIHCDILNTNYWNKLPNVNTIVSNPPYIPLRDKITMQANVLNYEPSLALFVPNEDVLLFYRIIADLAIAKKAKTIYFEIHEEQGNAIILLLQDKEFKKIEFKKDMQGKDRFIKAHYTPS